MVGGLILLFLKTCMILIAIKGLKKNNLGNSKELLVFREKKTDKLRKQTKLGLRENFKFKLKKNYNLF